MNHKLIMENWKSFLNENTDKKMTNRLGQIYTATYGIGLIVQAFGGKPHPKIKNKTYKTRIPNFMTNLKAMGASSKEMQQILRDLAVMQGFEEQLDLNYDNSDDLEPDF